MNAGSGSDFIIGGPMASLVLTSVLIPALGMYIWAIVELSVVQIN